MHQQTSDKISIRFPTKKKTKALFVGSVAKVIEITSAMAVNIPPKACPDTTAVMYSELKRPDTPNRLPLIMAEKTEEEIF
jgi:hypothetical protein